MTFYKEFLFTVAAIVYVVILLFLLLKRTYNLRQQIVFAALYITVVLMAAYLIFPLNIGTQKYDFRISPVPFQNIVSCFRYTNPDPESKKIRFLYHMLLCLFSSFVIGYLIGVLSKRRTIAALAGKSALVLLPVYIVYAVTVLNGSDSKIYDSSCFLFAAAGAGLGILVFRHTKLGIDRLMGTDEKEEGEV